MKTFYQAISLLLLLASAAQSHANNTRFLPGDAFFYIRLNLKEIQKIQNTESPLLTYGNHWSGGFGCGYWGFDEIRLLKIPPGTRHALLETYRELQPEIEKRDDLQGKMSLFIYNKKYDWQKYGLGLQYNENWIDESVDLGMSRDHARLESFVEKTDSIIQNWKFSKTIPALKVELPERPEEHRQGWTNHPVRINYDQCQLLIIPDREFDNYLRPPEGLKVIQIVDDKRTVFHFSKSKYKWIPNSE